MGGSGGGGSFSSKDMSKIQEAAEERLRALASKSAKVLFVCEESDKASLETLLAKSPVFTKDRIIVVDASQAKKVDNALEGASFLVYFTDATKAASFIDGVIDKAMVKKIGGVHVKAHSKSVIPSKISAYRIRSITWRELETIFK
jgi:predicted RNA-binding protein with PIN domain